MQRLISLIFLTCFSCFLSAQEAPKQQKTLITKVTATWCRTCGEVAWDNFREIIKSNSENAVCLAAHFSPTSTLHNPIAAEFAQNLPELFGQPTFYVNQTKQQSNNLVETVNNLVLATNEQLPIANTGISIDINTNEITATTNTKFFQTTEGEFYLSLFLVENEVIANQASRGNNVPHERIIRASFFEDAMGIQVGEGNIMEGTEKKITANINLLEGWQLENLEIVSIVWQKEADEFKFVNTNSIPLSLTTATAERQKPMIQLSVQPTILPTHSQIKLTIDRPLKNAKITLSDLYGQQLHTIFSGYLNNGLHEFNLATFQPSTSGTYFLILENNGFRWTQKIIVL